MSELPDFGGPFDNFYLTPLRFTHRLHQATGIAHATEPGPFVAFTADDGYGTEMDFFASLSSRGVHGTLFLSADYPRRGDEDVDPGLPWNRPSSLYPPPNWTDTYITSDQVRELVAQGHEIGFHGDEHENLVTKLTGSPPSGFAGDEAAFDNWLRQVNQKVIDITAKPVLTGAYTYGDSTPRIREIFGRHWYFFRGVGDGVDRNPPHPFYALTKSILGQDPEPPNQGVLVPFDPDVETLLEGARDNASLLVLQIHGLIGVDPQDLDDLIGEIVAWCVANQVPMGTFIGAMASRFTQIDGVAGIDSTGHAYYRGLRTESLEIMRSDDSDGNLFIGIDEDSGSPQISATTQAALEVKDVSLDVETALHVGQGDTQLRFSVDAFSEFDGDVGIAENRALNFADASIIQNGRTWWSGSSGIFTITPGEGGHLRLYTAVVQVRDTDDNKRIELLSGSDTEPAEIRVFSAGGDLKVRISEDGIHMGVDATEEKAALVTDAGDSDRGKLHLTDADDDAIKEATLDTGQDAGENHLFWDTP